MDQPVVESPHGFAAFVGIDWAERKHVFALQNSGPSKVEFGEIEHTPEAVDAWAMELSQRFGGQSVAVALEQVRGALVLSDPSLNATESLSHKIKCKCTALFANGILGVGIAVSCVCIGFDAFCTADRRGAPP
jgi:hypothetical protein